jgi:hypothetical protein
MKKKLNIHYPWEQTARGQGFFVPCLDTETVRSDGLRKALGMRLLDARAYAAIKDGKIGVWFYRLH